MLTYALCCAGPAESIEDVERNGHAGSASVSAQERAARHEPSLELGFSERDVALDTSVRPHALVAEGLTH